MKEHQSLHSSKPFSSEICLSFSLASSLYGGVRNSLYSLAPYVPKCDVLFTTEKLRRSWEGCIKQAWGVTDYMEWDYLIRIQKSSLYSITVTENRGNQTTFSKNGDY